MEGNHPPNERTSFDLGAIKTDDAQEDKQIKLLDEILSPCKTVSPFQGLQAADSIGELGMKRLSSIDDGEFGFNAQHIAAQKTTLSYKAVEVPTLSRHKFNRKDQCERLATYAERHGIHGIAITGNETEFDQDFLDELNYDNPMLINE